MADVPAPVVLRDDDDDYFRYAALVLAGQAEVVFRRQVSPGIRESWFVPVQGRSNPAPALTRRISFGREFYRTPLKTYRNWREAWWREAIQNAVDAGASHVALDVVEEEGAWRVSCTDDAGGMDVDTLIGTFLALGGTSKKGPGGTGGFGKAKELLILPWLGWEVHTRGVVVRGQGGDYGEPEKAAVLHGTRLTVWMDRDETTGTEHAQAYLEKCFLPAVAFTIVGHPVSAGLAPGEQIREVEAGPDAGLVVYFDRSAASSQYMLVRANGLFMFTRYIGDMPGRVIAELHGRPYRVLLDSRDDFSDWRLAEQVQNFAREVAVDVLTALRKGKGLTKTVYRGTGLVEASESMAAGILGQAPAFHAREAAKESGEAPGGPAPQRLDADFVRWVTHGMEEVAEAAAGRLRRGESPVFVSSGATAAALLDQPFRTAREVEAAIRTLSWMPDVYVVNEVENLKIPKTWLPGPGMAVRARQILRLWSEACRLVLIAMGESEPFGVGWIVSSEVGGEYRREPDPETNEERDWLLLNPFRVVEEGGRSRPLPRFRLSDDGTLPDLFATAQHEVAHLLAHTGTHDEVYARTLTECIRRTAQRFPAMRKLRQAVAHATRGGAAPDAPELEAAAAWAEAPEAWA